MANNTLSLASFDKAVHLAPTIIKRWLKTTSFPPSVLSYLGVSREDDAALEQVLRGLQGSTENEIFLCDYLLKDRVDLCNADELEKSLEETTEEGCDE
ncbi:hypothetical protein FOL46_001248 [Perkinsus olseni]|uniref:Uncharacterized protein n=1 Tax=Perkinsus olseni TaxID=32597 RepID=A0A7J6KSM8_PEROL|nr:hypothetical protein FOL46_001248 [Perkinsus olseni]